MMLLLNSQNTSSSSPKTTTTLDTFKYTNPICVIKYVYD